MYPANVLNPRPQKTPLPIDVIFRDPAASGSRGADAKERKDHRVPLGFQAQQLPLHLRWTTAIQRDAEALGW